MAIPELGRGGGPGVVGLLVDNLGWKAGGAQLPLLLLLGSNHKRRGRSPVVPGRIRASPGTFGGMGLGVQWRP